LIKRIACSLDPIVAGDLTCNFNSAIIRVIRIFQHAVPVLTVKQLLHIAERLVYERRHSLQDEFLGINLILQEGVYDFFSRTFGMLHTLASRQ
jgi:hypothetical protein